MAKEYFNLSVEGNLKSWTLMEGIVGIVGIIGVLALEGRPPLAAVPGRDSREKGRTACLMAARPGLR